VVPATIASDATTYAHAAAAVADAVVLCGDDPALGELASVLADEHGIRVAVFHGDVRDDADRATLTAMIDELFGPSRS
jgi:hypothetical protein